MLKLTSNLQTRHVVRLRQFEPESLRVVVVGDDFSKPEVYKALVATGKCFRWRCSLRRSGSVFGGLGRIGCSLVRAQESVTCSSSANGCSADDPGCRGGGGLGCFGRVAANALCERSLISMESFESGRQVESGQCCLVVKLSR